MSEIRNELQEQIELFKYDIYVDEYPMSINEITSYYKEKDLNLSPLYQRVFKWTDEQKTKLIESLLLGIPLPPIFLFQDERGLWEVIDGVQRLSSIFEFVGILESYEDTYREFKLVKAPKLTKLEGTTFDSWPKSLQREFKKLKLNFIIVQKKSHKDMKYEIFKRLNGFGTQLVRQELRNAIIIMENEDWFEHIKEMSENNDFKESMSFTETQLSNKVNYEYVIRFIIICENTLLSKSTNADDITDFFDDAIIEIIREKDLEIEKVKSLFFNIFRFLNELKNRGINLMQKYDSNKNKFSGKTTESIFEVIIPGLSENIDKIESANFSNEFWIEFVKSLYSKESPFLTTLKPNPRAIARFKKLAEISINTFNGIDYDGYSRN